MTKRRNHNPKKVGNFLEQQKRQRELAEKVSEDLKRNRIRANTIAWLDTVPQAVKDARVSKLTQSTKDKIKNINFREPFKNMVVVTSELSTSGIYVNYALIRSIIMSGIATPSEIRITSLLEGYNNINGMFQARSWKEHFFDPSAKVLVIEGASLNLARLGNKGETQFWRELREFTRNHDKLVIISYIAEPNEVTGDMLIPILSTDRALNTQLVRNCSFIMLNKEEEENIQNEQKRLNELL